MKTLAVVAQISDVAAIDLLANAFCKRSAFIRLAWRARVGAAPEERHGRQ
jgi:hypothetical protein